MEDVTPKLSKELEDDFKKRYRSNKKIKKLVEQLDNKKADYKTAQEYAIEVGNELAKTFDENLSSAILPDGKLYYNIANRIIPERLKENYDLVGDYCDGVQKKLNEEAKIGLQPARPPLNQDKVDKIVDIVSGKDDFDKIAYMLKDPIVNFTQCIVDDAVFENVKRHSKAGLRPKIIRTSTGDCCNWCDKLAGIYDYEDVKNGSDVFRRHRNCNCVVEYKTIDGRIQNVHTKYWKTANEDLKTFNLGKASKEVYPGVFDVTDEYIKNAKPNQGDVIFEIDSENKKLKNEKETAIAINKIFGGEIVAKKEPNKDRVKSPDYLWKGKLWELKTLGESTVNAVDKRLQDANRQLRQYPGLSKGVVVNLPKGTTKNFVQENVPRLFRKRIIIDGDCIVMIDGKLVGVYRK